MNNGFEMVRAKGASSTRNKHKNKQIELGKMLDASFLVEREEGRFGSVFTEDRTETEVKRGGGLDFRLSVLSTGISNCITRL